MKISFQAIILCSLSFMVLSAPMAHGEFSADWADLYDSQRNRPPGHAFPVHYTEADASVHVAVLSDSCEAVDSFVQDFKKWSHRFPSLGRPPGEHTKEFLCECRKSVCGSELTAYFPKVFSDKMFKELKCNGPNCYNATLLASRFLESEQIRYSSEAELNYYLKRYCTQVDRSKVATNHVVLLTHSVDRETLHAGVYISDGFVFTKGGPGRDSEYGFEDWNNALQSDQVVVYRCRERFYKEYNSDLRLAESAYTQLIQMDLAEDQRISLFSDLEHILGQIPSNGELRENEIPALKSLAASIYCSKEKIAVIELEKGKQILTHSSVIQYFQTSSTDSATPAVVQNFKSVDQLHPGDWVMIHADYAVQSKEFEVGKLYRVVRIL